MKLVISLCLPLLLLPGGIALNATETTNAGPQQTARPPTTREIRAPDPAGSKPVPRKPRLVYTPPRLKAPRVSTGPGSRGDGSEPIVLSLFAPEHAGLTTLEQPTLYWYQSAGTSHAIEITLVIPGQATPLLQSTVPGGRTAAVQAIDLQKLGVRLKEGVTYRWSVAIVVDPAHRSKDLVASSVIERVPEPRVATPPANESTPWEKAAAAAQSGLWHDAISNLTRRNGKEQWEGFAQLARQIDQNELADFCDRQSMR